jgi:hypothetical protein
VTNPRAFVSFDFDNNEVSRNLFCGQGKEDSPTPFTVEDWSSKSVLSQSNWEALIEAKINKTNMVIVLVGKSMSTASGVVAEIAMAKRCNVPVFGVYVDGADTTSTLPVGLPRNRTVAWTWANVAAGIDQCMTEGKNA